MPGSNVNWRTVIKFLWRFHRICSTISIDFILRCYICEGKHGKSILDDLYTAVIPNYRFYGINGYTVGGMFGKKGENKQWWCIINTVVFVCSVLSMIVAYAIENGQVTRKEVEELLESGSTKAFRLLRELCEEGKLEAEGNGKLSRYVPRTWSIYGVR